MADSVTTNILENGPRRVVMSFTNLSDGTGETGVTKVDGSATGPLGVTIAGNTVYPLGNLKVVDAWFNVYGGMVEIAWGGTSNQDFLNLTGFGHFKALDKRGGFQGWFPPASITPNGKILFTTHGFVANSSYTIVLEMTKGIPQS
jgi:hypothetical protein